MPFPSGRCQICRARHIKCDEKRPTCTQCSKAARPCTWDETDSGRFFFRDENEFASSRAKRQRGGGRRPASAVGQQENSSTTSLALRTNDQERPAAPVSQTLESSSAPSLLIRPTESIETHALNKLVRRFIETESNLAADVWGFLREYQADFFPLTSHPSFTPAVMALALAHFGRTSHDASAIAASRRYYSQALVNTSQAVQSRSTAVADEVILTVIFLSGYEDHLGNFDHLKLRSQGFTHLEGVTALMKVRERCGETSRRSQHLNQFVRRRVVRSSISHGVSVPQLIQMGELYDGQPMCTALYKCLIQVAGVRNSAHTALRNLTSSPTQQRRSQLVELQQIVKDVRNADSQLDVWRSRLPDEWHYETRVVSEDHYNYCLSSGIFFSRQYHTCSGQEVPLILNTYRAARLVTLGLLLKFSAIDPSVNQMLAQCYAINTRDRSDCVHRLVEEIAATMPAYFDAIAKPPRTREELIQRTPVNVAMHLIWPLLIASATLQIPRQLRDYIKSVLLLVSQIGGSAILEMLANMDLHTLLASQPQNQRQ